MPENVPPDAFGPEAFAAQTNVSRETLDRLKAYVELLREWSDRHNLVSARSLEHVWHRHVWDSAQLVAFIPRDARTLVDLGSGAGFPGLVVAEMLRGQVSVALYEATRKKAEFLAAAALRLDLDVAVYNARSEAAEGRPADVVTARAVAPLVTLLGYAQPFFGERTRGLFHKGQSVASELTKARKSWSMKVSQHQSATDPTGVILEIRDLGLIARKPRPKRQ